MFFLVNVWVKKEEFINKTSSPDFTKKAGVLNLNELNAPIFYEISERNLDENCKYTIEVKRYLIMHNSVLLFTKGADFEDYYEPITDLRVVSGLLKAQNAFIDSLFKRGFFQPDEYINVFGESGVYSKERGVYSKERASVPALYLNSDNKEVEKWL